MAVKIKVQTEEPKRLDVYLSAFYGESRSQLQKFLKKTTASVNKEAATPHTKVRDGDEIELADEPDFSPLPPVEAPPFPEIIYEDDDTIVINKPAGLQMHPAHIRDQAPTLTHAIRTHRPELNEVGEDPEVRPAMVHRLDKDASGVVVLAKSDEAFSVLKSQFQHRETVKIYTVLAYGSIGQDHGEIKFRLERSKTKGKMIAIPEDEERGRDALTEYDVLERYAKATLLKVRIHTGRTHQIRTHFFAIDHPVVGDKLYKKRLMKNIKPIELNRLFLHATELTLTLPSGEKKTFAAKLPEELQDVLSSLK